MNEPAPPAAPAAPPYVNTQFLANMLMGGLAGGTGIGLVTALMRQRRALLDDREEPELLPIDLPQTKLASQDAGPLAWLMNGMNWAGKSINQVAGSKPVTERPAGQLGLLDYSLGAAALPLAGIAGLQGTNKLFQYWRQKDLKDRLREDQEAYMEALMAERDSTKQATTGAPTGNRPMGAPDLAAMLVMGVPLLTAITSAVMTDRYLENQLPKNRDVVRGSGPRPLTFNTPQPNEEEALDEPTKMAAVATMVDVAMNLPTRHDCGLGDLLGVIARGHIKEAESILALYGTDALFDFADGAITAFEALTDLEKKATIHVGTAVSALSPMLATCAAMEMAEALPSWRVKGAAVRQSPELECQAIKYGSLVWSLGCRAAMETEKVAAVMPGVAAPLANQQLRAMFEGAQSPVQQLNRGAAAASSEHSAPKKDHQYEAPGQDDIDAALQTTVAV